MGTACEEGEGNLGYIELNRDTPKIREMPNRSNGVGMAGLQAIKVGYKTSTGEDSFNKRQNKTEPVKEHRSIIMGAISQRKSNNPSLANKCAPLRQLLKKDHK